MSMTPKEGDYWKSAMRHDGGLPKLTRKEMKKKE